jgi:hypothetical protein
MLFPKTSTMRKKIGPAVISALPRVTRRQSPAQFARDRSALMLGQSLAERQRFAAMTQHQTRHPIARIGLDFEPSPEPVELAGAPRNARPPQKCPAGFGPLCHDNLSMKDWATLAWIATTRKIGSRFDRVDRAPLGRISAMASAKAYDNEAATLPAAASATRSSLSSPPPAATGFMPTARNPAATYFRSSAHETVVLPTPVSVPVMKMPSVIASLAVRRG